VEVVDRNACGTAAASGQSGRDVAARQPEKYDRAAARWHVRSVYDSKNVDLRESLAVLALLAAIPANRLAATALAELLGRPRGLERAGEVLVGCARVT
jgi:hypothetical protein